MSARTTPFDNNDLVQGSILRALIKLAIPIVIANILQSGYQLIDTYWVGRLGGVAVAAVSITTPIAFLTISFGIGFAVAGGILIAQYTGAKNKEMVDHVAGQTLLMVALLSIVFGAIGYVASPAIVGLMGVAPDVVPGAVGFMRVSFIGMLFNFVFFMFQGIMRGIGEATLPVWIVLGTVILNFALDPIFIFGWGPIAGHGVVGAAIATVGTQSIAAAIGIWILAKGKYGIQLHLKELRPDWAYVKRAFLLGFPASIEMSARALGFTVMTLIVATFGTTAVASYGIGSNILQIAVIPALGLSMAIATVAGQNIGAGSMERASRTGIVGAWLGFVVLTLFGILSYFFADALIRFFVPSDEAVIAGGSLLIRIMSWSWGFMAVQLALTGIFRASGNMVLSMVITLVSQWVLQFPIAYILAYHTSLGINGIWWAFPISNVLIVAITMIVYSTDKWKQKTIINNEERKLERAVSEEAMAEERF